MGVENGMFRSEIGSGFEDPGGTPPPRIPRSTPPGVRSELWDLSLKFVVVRKVMHSTVGLHRVRLLFSLNFISVFIGVYSLGTTIH